jgi:protease I
MNFSRRDGHNPADFFSCAAAARTRRRGGSHEPGHPAIGGSMPVTMRPLFPYTLPRRGNVMIGKLTGKTIAILATDGFEQSELQEPKKALEAEGAKTEVVSLESGTIKGWKLKNWGQDVPVDMTIKMAQSEHYEGLLLPGGVMNPDRLRTEPKAVEFVRRFFADGKPVAAICHGPWLLVEADVLHGIKLTSWPSLRTDIRNAGGEWVDQEVVVDHQLVTSRRPDDLPAFNRKMLEVFAQAPIKKVKIGATDVT